MTDLTDFGLEVPDEEDEEEEESPGTDKFSKRRQDYRRGGRCKAIARGGSRCRNGVGRAATLTDVCNIHNRQDEPITIDSSPEELMWRTSKQSARCRAIQGDDSRCTNGCYPTELCCGVHEDVTCELVPERHLETDDDGHVVEVDARKIQAALEPQQMLWEGKVPAFWHPDAETYKAWLPREMQHAAQLVARTRDTTQDNRSFHGEGWVFWKHNEGTDDEDARNPHLESDEIQLKEYGEDEQTFQVVTMDG